MTHRSSFSKACFTLAVLVCGCASQGGVSKDTRATLYVTQHPEVSSRFASAILAGSVLIGMSPDMVQAAWGAPTRVEKNAGTKADEKWIYGNYLVNSAVTHLYFKKGELVLYELKDTQSTMTQSISDPNKKLPLLSRPPSENEAGAKSGPN
jgi:hypothetical protein